jgi:hypothetical protein
MALLCVKKRQIMILLCANFFSCAFVMEHRQVALHVPNEKHTTKYEAYSSTGKEPFSDSGWSMSNDGPFESQGWTIQTNNGI